MLLREDGTEIDSFGIMSGAGDKKGRTDVDPVRGSFLPGRRKDLLPRVARLAMHDDRQTSSFFLHNATTAGRQHHIIIPTPTQSGSQNGNKLSIFSHSLPLPDVGQA